MIFSNNAFIYRLLHNLFFRKIEYLFFKILKKSRGKSVSSSSIVCATSKIESGSSFINSSLGRNSFCGYDCNIINTEIGSFCSIASNVTIGGLAHPMHFVSTSPVFLSHKDSVKNKFARHDYLPVIKTIIGHDVWIGDGVFVKAGVSVGTGAVLGMGAVVTKNVDPYTVVAGNPAKIIKKRFDNKIIQSLLETEWWNKDDVELSKLGPYINDPEEFIKKSFNT